MHFTFARLETGRIAHGRCMHNPPHDRCQLAVSRGALTLSAGAGLSRVRFEGRITRRQLLPPGLNTLTLAAEAAGASSVPRRLSFRIVA